MDPEHSEVPEGMRGQKYLHNPERRGDQDLLWNFDRAGIEMGVQFQQKHEFQGGRRHHRRNGRRPS